MRWLWLLLVVGPITLGFIYLFREFRRIDRTDWGSGL